MSQSTNILSKNIYDPIFNEKFLIVGACLPSIQKKVLSKFTKIWKNWVTICLEEEHYNKLISKLFNILATGNTKKVGFLTVDGSPHCIQMHFSSKYLKRGLKNDVEFEHYVIGRDGKVYKVPMEKVDEAKTLMNVGTLVK